VEGQLDKLPDVIESAVVGVPHADFGEGVIGIIVTRDGQALDEAGLIKQLKVDLANYKVPKRLFFVDELPRNAMGKVQKNVLRQYYDLTFKNGD
jgi:malonyl-CoA/methylmalonyl-CoA synthetase